MTNAQYIEETTTRNYEIAVTILNQMGGRRFAVMTGAKDFTAIKDGIQFKIGRNISKANRVEIKLNGLDLYDIEFIKHRPFSIKVDHKKGEVRTIEEQSTTVRKFEDIYCDQLEELFSEVTGLYTHF